MQNPFVGENSYICLFFLLSALQDRVKVYKRCGFFENGLIEISRQAETMYLLSHYLFLWDILLHNVQLL